jgi:ribonuclease HI
VAFLVEKRAHFPAKPAYLDEIRLTIRRHTVDYTITFDGGSRNNGSPDAEGYGSYEISTATGRTEIIRLTFPAGTTNNEAEYKSLIASLEDLVGRIQRANRAVGGFTLELRGDSALVLNQVQGTWKTKKEHLRPLRDRAQALIALFKSLEFVWQPREESVQVLGH